MLMVVCVVGCRGWLELFGVLGYRDAVRVCLSLNVNCTYVHKDEIQNVKSKMILVSHLG